jgi:hypothetical protein
MSWKLESNYEYAAELNARGRAWEYLRRNGDYRKDWFKYAELISLLEAKHGPRSTWGHMKLLTITELLHHDPPRMDGEKFSDWLSKAYAMRREPVREPHEVAFGRPWRLRRMLDFAQPGTGQEEFIPPPSRTWFHAGDVPDDRPEKWGTYAYVEIDLRKHISTQLKGVQRALRNFQDAKVTSGQIPAPKGEPGAKAPNPHPNFVLHLRALDAKEAGASGMEIASVLYPDKPNDLEHDYSGSKAVDDLLEQAETFRDGAYRTLI